MTGRKEFFYQSISSFSENGQLFNCTEILIDFQAISLLQFLINKSLNVTKLHYAFNVYCFPFVTPFRVSNFFPCTNSDCVDSKLNTHY